MDEQKNTSVFEKDRVMRARNPKLSYAISFVTGGAAAFFIVSQNSFIGVILALVAAETLIVQRGMSDRATYMTGMAAFAIAGILGVAFTWTWPGAGTHINLILVFVPALIWGYKYRRALSINLPTK